MVDPAGAPRTLQLAADFSREQDVLVLAGVGSAPWLQDLSRVGIEHVLVYSPTEPAPPAGRHADDLPGLLAKLLDFEPSARRITLQRLPDGGLNEEQFDELKKAVQNCSVNRTTFATSGATWVNHALAN